MTRPPRVSSDLSCLGREGRGQHTLKMPIRPQEATTTLHADQRRRRVAKVPANAALMAGSKSSSRASASAKAVWRHAARKTPALLRRVPEAKRVAGRRVVMLGREGSGRGGRACWELSSGRRARARAGGTYLVVVVVISLLRLEWLRRHKGRGKRQGTKGRSRSRSRFDFSVRNGAT